MDMFAYRAGPRTWPGRACSWPEAEEIRRFQDAVRARIECAAADARRDPRDIPAGRTGAAIVRRRVQCQPSTGTAEEPVWGRCRPGRCPRRADLRPRSTRHARPPPRPPSVAEDLERGDLLADPAGPGGRRPACSGLAGRDRRRSLAQTDALQERAARGDRDRKRPAARRRHCRYRHAEQRISPRWASCSGTGDHEAAELQRRLDGQGAEFRALGEMVRRQSADVRIAPGGSGSYQATAVQSGPRRSRRRGSRPRATGPADVLTGGCSRSTRPTPRCSAAVSG